jgi:hypothetical protein
MQLQPNKLLGAQPSASASQMIRRRLLRSQFCEQVQKLRPEPELVNLRSDQRRSCSKEPEPMPQPETTPDRIAPDLIAPDLIAPDLIAPDGIAPDEIAPGVIAPDRIAPDLIRRLYSHGTRDRHPSHSRRCSKELEPEPEPELKSEPEPEPEP